MCEDMTRRECSDLHHLHPDTVSLYLETAAPDYQGHCRPTTLSINQTVSGTERVSTPLNSTYRSVQYSQNRSIQGSTERVH